MPLANCLENSWPRNASFAYGPFVGMGKLGRIFFEPFISTKELWCMLLWCWQDRHVHYFCTGYWSSGEVGSCLRISNILIVGARWVPLVFIYPIATKQAAKTYRYL